MSMSAVPSDGQPGANATGSVELTYSDFKADKQAAFYYGISDQRLRVRYVNDTTFQVQTSVVPVHIKIEGVKRTSQVSITSSDKFRQPVYVNFNTTTPGAAKSFSDYYGNTFNVLFTAGNNRGFSLTGDSLSKVTKVHMTTEVRYAASTGANSFYMSNLASGQNFYFKVLPGMREGATTIVEDLAYTIGSNDHYVLVSNVGKINSSSPSLQSVSGYYMDIT